MKTLRNAGIALIFNFLAFAISFIVIGIIGFFWGLAQGIFLLISIFSNPSNLISLLGINLLWFPLHGNFPVVNIAFAIFYVILIIFIYAGFISLGKRFNNKFLKRVSWILMFVLLTMEITRIIAINTNSDKYGVATGLFIFILLLSISIFYILLGVCIKKLKEIEKSKTVGIFYIISGPTIIIPMVGPIFLTITQILAAIMFFKASKKFESNSLNPNKTT